MPHAAQTVTVVSVRHRGGPSQAFTAVDDIECLTSGLSRKNWQKIMILDRYLDREPGL